MADLVTLASTLAQAVPAEPVSQIASYAPVGAGLAMGFAVVGGGIGIGLVGAAVGGVLFRLFGILPGLETISISLRDVVSAFTGSILFLLGLWLWQKRG